MWASRVIIVLVPAFVCARTVDFFDSYVTTLPDRNGKEMLDIDFSLDEARTALDLAERN